MLGKLIKNEFKATGRLFLPIYLIFIVIVALTKITDFFQGTLEQNMITNIIGKFILLTFVLSMIAIIVVTAVITVKRFYDNMLKDEGYLSFTLPVSTGQHVFTKALVSYIWVVITCILFTLSLLFIMSSGNQTFFDYFKAVPELMKEISKHNAWPEALLIIGMVIVTLYNYIMEAYACLSLGQLSNKHKFGGAILAFIIFYAISQFVGIIFISLYGNSSQYVAASSIHDIQPILIYGLVFSLVQAVAYTVITKITLSKRLNLE